MRKLLILAGTASALLLAGCGDGASSGATSKREAGNWVNEVELVKFEVPGMPDELRAGMKEMMASSANNNFCLTPAEAAKDDLETLLNEGPAQNGECTWSKKEVNGKNVDVAGTCTADGQTADLAMVGTMEPRQSDVTITTKAKLPDGKDMEMVMRVKSKRTGACEVGAEIAPSTAATPK